MSARELDAEYDEEGEVEMSLVGGGTAIDPTQIGGVTRYYEKEFPDLEDLVVVNVRSVEEMGAYVTLLEYNNIEGMILLSELSRRRIRSIAKLLRVGRDEVVMVIRVTKDKGYIDLSKRRVAVEDIPKAEEKYNKAKAVHSIIKHVSGKLRVPMLSLYQRVAWPLYRTYGHAYDALQVAVTDPETIFKDIDIKPEEKVELLNYIQLKMTPQPLKIRTDIQVTCIGYEGVEAIRAALLAAQAVSTEAIPIKVQLIAPPLYVMTTHCLDKVAGIAALTKAIEVATEEITKRGGRLTVKMAPVVTSSRDDSELQRMLEDLEVGAESSGSESDGEEEEDMGMGMVEEEEGAGAAGGRSKAKSAAAAGDESDE